MDLPDSACLEFGARTASKSRTQLSTRRELADLYRREGRNERAVVHYEAVS